MFVNTYERAMFENFTEYRVMKYLWCGVPPILLIFGTFGNIMVFLVLRRQSRTASTYVYLIALAGADEVVIFVSITKRWMEHVLGYQLDCLHPITCKLFHFITSSFSHMSVWVIVLVTIERLFVVAVPLKATGRATVGNARVILVILVILSFVLNFHFLFTMQILNHKEVVYGRNWTLNVSMYYCDMRHDIATQWRTAWPWIDALVYSHAPFFLILISNVVIVYKLRVARVTRRQLTAEQPDSLGCLISTTCCLGKKYRRSSHEIHKTAMLLVVSLMFLITATPVAILKITISVLLHYTTLLQQPHFNAIFILASTITELLMITNHSVNFFLYCMAGQKFRRDFQRTFCPFLRRIFDFDQDPLERLSFGGTKQKTTISRNPANTRQLVDEDIELQIMYTRQCLTNDFSNKTKNEKN